VREAAPASLRRYTRSLQSNNVSAIEAIAGLRGDHRAVDALFERFE